MVDEKETKNEEPLSKTLERMLKEAGIKNQKPNMKNEVPEVSNEELKKIVVGLEKIASNEPDPAKRKQQAAQLFLDIAVD